MQTVIETIYEANACTTLQNITDRVKTFEDACKVLNLDKVKIGIGGLDEDAPSIVAYTKLVIIAKALNEGWKPNWSDSNEYKYVPWFKEKSGFGLSYDVYDGWVTFTAVGSRLCYKSRELAEYAGKQFADLYNEFLTIK